MTYRRPSIGLIATNLPVFLGRLQLSVALRMAGLIFSAVRRNKSPPPLRRSRQARIPRYLAGRCRREPQRGSFARAKNPSSLVPSASFDRALIWAQMCLSLVKSSRSSSCATTTPLYRTRP